MTAIAKARPMVEGSSLSSDEWCTPKWLCELLGTFDLDPASNTRSNVAAHRWCGPDHAFGQMRDGLSFDWSGSVFVNPPFSNVMPWAQKLAAHDGPWCALIKLDPSTRWYAALMVPGVTVAPFKKRLKFEGDKDMTANFPCALVYRAWAPSRELAEHLWIARYA